MSSALDRLKERRAVEAEVKGTEVEDVGEDQVSRAKEVIAADEAKERATGNMEGGAIALESNEPEAITITMDQLNNALRMIVDDFSEKMATTENKIEEMKLTLELQSAKAEAGKPTKSRIDVTAVQHGPMDHQSALVELHQDQLQGKYARFVNNRPDIRSLRRSQGFEPVIDKDKNEVRFMDGVLMVMPQDRYDKTIREPKERKKAFRRAAIPRRFHDRGKDEGVDTFGDITYDGEK